MSYTGVVSFQVLQKRRSERERKRVQRLEQRQAILNDQLQEAKQQIAVLRAATDPWKQLGGRAGYTTSCWLGVNELIAVGVPPYKVKEVLQIAHGEHFIKKNFLREDAEYPKKTACYEFQLEKDSIMEMVERERFNSDQGPLEIHWDVGSRGGKVYLVVVIAMSRLEEYFQAIQPFLPVINKTGESVANGLDALFKEMNLDIKRFRVIVTDAGGENVGVNLGAISRIFGENGLDPIFVHCVLHGINLRLERTQKKPG